MRPSRLLAFIAVGFVASVLSAQNPVPFIDQPLVPTSVAPGGPQFTLTVNGAGFVSGSVVNWNGSPRSTTFHSGEQLTATILQSDIATATTATVTVSSPAPGGGTSNRSFSSVRNASSFVSFNTSRFRTGKGGEWITAADFNGDNNLDLALANNSSSLSVYLGNGDGTFRHSADYVTGAQPQSIAVADLNGDGKPDVMAALGNSGIGVLLGNGDGTFRPQVNYATGETAYNVVAGDFNGDGKLDLAVGAYAQFEVLLGNGDGTFQAHSDYLLDCAGYPTRAVVADFNSDGILDAAVANCNWVSILLGNGNGTFQSPVNYTVGGGGTGLVAASDLDGDGAVDLAVPNSANGVPPSVSILYNNGNGTFNTHVDYSTPNNTSGVEAADLNGDDLVDLAVIATATDYNSVSLFLGNAGRNFQPRIDYGANAGFALAVGDFNGDGRIDAAVANLSENSISILLQDDGSVISLSPYILTFPTQLVGTVSSPKKVTLHNSGSAPVTIQSIVATTNFAELNGCHNSVPAGGSCIIYVFFTPTVQDALQGFLAVTDNGGGSPQVVNLSGTGTVVLFTPNKVDFGAHKIGTPTGKNVTLTNKGTGKLSITGIGIAGGNKSDFFEVNACGSSLAAGASCNITVIFRPTVVGTRTATLQVSDSGGGSPQSVPLTGTGTN